MSVFAKTLSTQGQTLKALSETNAKQTEGINDLVQQLQEQKTTSNSNDSLVKNILEQLTDIVEKNTTFVHVSSEKRKNMLRKNLLTVTAGLLVMRVVLFVMHLSSPNLVDGTWWTITGLVGIQVLTQAIMFVKIKFVDKHLKKDFTHLTSDIPVIVKSLIHVRADLLVALCSLVVAGIGVVKSILAYKELPKNEKDAFTRLNMANSQDDQIGAMKEILSSMTLSTNVVFAGVNTLAFVLALISATTYKKPDLMLVGVDNQTNLIAGLMADVATVAA